MTHARPLVSRDSHRLAVKDVPNLDLHMEARGMMIL